MGHQRIDALERARLDSSMRRVYAALQRAGARGLLNHELVSQTHALDAPRRARELRAKGFAIEVTREDAGAWRYRLLQSRPLALTLDRSRPVVPVRADDLVIDGMTQQPLFDDDEGGGC